MKIPWKLASSNNGDAKEWMMLEIQGVFQPQGPPSANSENSVPKVETKENQTARANADKTQEQQPESDKNPLSNLKTEKARLYKDGMFFGEIADLNLSSISQLTKSDEGKSFKLVVGESLPRREVGDIAQAAGSYQKAGFVGATFGRIVAYSRSDSQVIGIQGTSHSDY